jgi:hypothetical protein
MSPTGGLSSPRKSWSYVTMTVAGSLHAPPPNGVARADRHPDVLYRARSLRIKTHEFGNVPPLVRATVGRVAQ